jgi:hypothetical protein
VLAYITWLRTQPENTIRAHRGAFG